MYQLYQREKLTLKKTAVQSLTKAYKIYRVETHWYIELEVKQNSTLSHISQHLELNLPLQFDKNKGFVHLVCPHGVFCL